jgi:hypothetical protein
LECEAAASAARDFVPDDACDEDYEPAAGYQPVCPECRPTDPPSDSE